VGYGRFITACKDGCNLRWPHGVLKRDTYCGPRTPRGAAAYGIDNHQNGTAARCKEPVYIGGSASLLDTMTSKVRTHGSDKNFGVSHGLILAGASSDGWQKLSIELKLRVYSSGM